MGLEATIIPTVLKIKRSQIILNEKVSQMNLSSNVIQDTIFLPPFEVQFQQWEFTDNKIKVCIMTILLYIWLSQSLFNIS